VANGADAPVHYAVPAIAHASQIGVAHDAFAPNGALVFVHFMLAAVAAIEFAARVITIRTIGGTAAAMAADEVRCVAAIPIGALFFVIAAVAGAPGHPLAVVRRDRSVRAIVAANELALHRFRARVAAPRPRAIVVRNFVGPFVPFR